MAPTVKEVKNSITATDKTRAAYASAAANAKRMANSTKGSLLSIKQAWKGVSAGMKIGAAAIVGAGTAALVLASKTAAAEDKIGKFAGRLNIAVEELTRYRHVAELSGVSNETLEKSFQKLPKSVADAAKGLAAPRDALAKLNLEAADLMELDPVQQFEAISSAMEDVANTSDRVQIAQDLMGRSGVEMLGIINQGTAAIVDMKNEADELGITLSTKSAVAAAEYEDTMTRMRGVVKGISRDIADDLIPQITSVAKAITDWVQDNEELIKQGLQTTINLLAASIKTVINLVNGFTRDFTMGEKFAETSESLTLMAQTGVISAAELTQALYNVDQANRVMQGGILDQSELSEGALANVLRLMEDAQARMGAGFGAAEDEEAAEEEIDIAEDPEVLRHAAIIQAKAELDLLGVEEEMALQEDVLKMKDAIDKKDLARQKKLAKQESALRRGHVSAVAGMLDNIGQQSKTAAKAAFELNKGLAIARSVQDGKSAAIKAYADLGPVAGTVAAALIIGITAANIAAIASTSMDGGGSVSAGDGGAGGIPSTGAAGTAEGSGGAAVAVDEDPPTTVNLIVQTMDPETVLERMAPQIEEFAQDGRLNIQVRTEPI